MAFKCGFFNAINSDRTYSAEQMNMPYKKIVSNGVFGDPESSTDLQVQATSGLVVNVKSGNGIFFDKWCELDADYPITLTTPHVSNPRIDSIVIRVDTSENVRAGTIEYLVGTPNATPTAPVLTNTSSRKEYRLANIAVGANASTITQSNITDTRPTSECGFITNLLWDSDITATYAQWQNQFDTWFNNLRLTLSTVTAITSFTSRYVTTENSETVIPISITRYNSVLDILQVYINGMILVEDTDYTITNNTSITLLHAVSSGTQISFIVYKSVDGTEAESVVDEVNTLFDLMPIDNNSDSKINVASGRSILTAFVNAGKGFRTLFANSGATDTPTTNSTYRCFGQMTSATAGYLIAISPTNGVYINNFATTWQGWKPLHNTKSETALWTGADVMPANQTITPSKTLSKCENGWILVWSGYENGEPLDDRISTQVIYKKVIANATPSETLFYHAIPQPITSNQNTAMVGKALYASDGQITGHDSNSVSPANGYVLRAVYEF